MAFCEQLIGKKRSSEIRRLYSDSFFLYTSLCFGIRLRLGFGAKRMFLFFQRRPLFFGKNYPVHVWVRNRNVQDPTKDGARSSKTLENPVGTTETGESVPLLLPPSAHTCACPSSLTSHTWFAEKLYTPPTSARCPFPVRG